MMIRKALESTIVNKTHETNHCPDEKTKDFGIDRAKLKKRLLLCNFDMVTSVDRGQKHVLQRI